MFRSNATERTDSWWISAPIAYSQGLHCISIRVVSLIAKQVPRAVMIAALKDPITSFTYAMNLITGSGCLHLETQDLIEELFHQRASPVIRTGNAGSPTIIWINCGTLAPKRLWPPQSPLGIAAPDLIATRSANSVFLICKICSMADFTTQTNLSPQRLFIFIPKSARRAPGGCSPAGPPPPPRAPPRGPCARSMSAPRRPRARSTPPGRS